MFNHKHTLLAILLFVVFGPAAYIYSDKISDVFAQNNTTSLTGYAWSSNIGWINLGGTGILNPAIKLDLSTGKLSGYAWSSNIGYIYFGDDVTAAGGISDAPQSPKVWATRGNDGKVIGWARACSVFVSGCNGTLRPPIQNGGWDGWIKMSGKTTGGQDYGVSIEVNPDGFKKISGFAWGGGSSVALANSPQFPGWIDFDAQVSDIKVEFNTPPNALVRFNDNITPTTAYKSGQPNVLPETTLVLASGSSCDAKIDLSVQKIEKTIGNIAISDLYWKGRTTFSPAQIVPGTSNTSSLKIDFVRMPTDPNTNQPIAALANGQYKVYILGSPEGGRCGGDFTTTMMVSVTAPFTGGVYIEQ